LHYEKKKENGKWKMEKSQSCMRPISHQLLQDWGKKWKVESGKWKTPISHFQPCRNTSPKAETPASTLIALDRCILQP
jgi:hypothetical protein